MDLLYSPLNLCCALGPVHAKCTMCHKDLCRDCFFESHVKGGNSMWCSNAMLHWATVEDPVTSDTDLYDKGLYPYQEKVYEK